MEETESISSIHPSIQQTYESGSELYSKQRRWVVALTKEATKRGLERRVALSEWVEVGHPLKEGYGLNKR